MLTTAAARVVSEQLSDAREADVSEMCDGGEDGECLLLYEEEGEHELVSAVQRCNDYNMEEYLPVWVESEQVGWISEEMAIHLQPHTGKPLAIAPSPPTPLPTNALKKSF